MIICQKCWKDLKNKEIKRIQFVKSKRVYNMCEECMKSELIQKALKNEEIIVLEK